MRDVDAYVEVSIDFAPRPEGISVQDHTFDAWLTFHYSRKHRPTEIQLSEGLVRILPNLDVPSHAYFSTWHADHFDRETLERRVRDTFLELSSRTTQSTEYAYLLSMLPPIYRNEFASVIRVLNDPDSSLPDYHAVQAIAVLDDRIFDEDSLGSLGAQCDQLLAAIKGYPDLQSYFLRHRLTPFELVEFRIDAQVLSTMEPIHLQYIDAALRAARKGIEDNVASCLSANLGSISPIRFSINDLYGKPFAYHGEIYAEPKASEVTALVGGSTLSDDDMTHVYDAVELAYTLTALKFEEDINTILDITFARVREEVERAPEVAKKQNGRGKSDIQSLYVADERAVGLTGWSQDEDLWVHNDFKAQSARFGSIGELAEKFHGGDIQIFLDTSAIFADVSSYAAPARGARR